MAWDRKQRQEAILREKIAIIVHERLSDPRLGFLTVTGVELSRDKRHAKVLYTVLGTDAQRRSTARALDDGVGRVQELLAPTLGMRIMPELRFVYDKAIEKEGRLLSLLEDLAVRRADAPDGSAPSQDVRSDARRGPTRDGEHEKPKPKERVKDEDEHVDDKDEELEDEAADDDEDEEEEEEEDEADEEDDDEDDDEEEEEEDEEEEEEEFDADPDSALEADDDAEEAADDSKW